MGESHGITLTPERVENGRRDEVHHRQVLEGRLQVLPQSKDITVGLAEVSHGFEHFFLSFTQPEHHARFGVNFVAEAVFDLGQHAEGPLIGGAMAHRRSQTANGLEVVVEDVWPSREDRIDRVVTIEEIGSQHLDNDSRIKISDRFDGAAEMFGSTILEVISSHGGDHHMLESHATGGLGDSLRLILFQGQWFGCRDRAESAGAGATISRDHEGRRALAPALPMIGALGTLANRVEAQAIEQRARGREGTGGG